MISKSKLNFWIENNLNVLFVGEYGVGKSSILTKALNDNNIRYKYYSAATMDPWVDFIGIPKEKIDEHGLSHLTLVRPFEFATDSVEAIVFDELNRAPAKVRNAVMELIQFKSINGYKFKNLRFVWAAINPDDSKEFDYDVDTLDPAQKDRFQVVAYIPYQPDMEYFTDKFGAKIAKSAIAWWNELDDEGKKLVSPRRLDYALSIHLINGDMRDVLNSKTNVTKLIEFIGEGSIEERIELLLTKKDKDEAKKFMSDPNNSKVLFKSLSNSNKLTEAKKIQRVVLFLPHARKEDLASELSNNLQLVQKISASKSKFDQEEFSSLEEKLKTLAMKTKQITLKKELDTYFPSEPKEGLLEISGDIDKIIETNSLNKQDSVAELNKKTVSLISIVANTSTTNDHREKIIKNIKEFTDSAIFAISDTEAILLYENLLSVGLYTMIRSSENFLKTTTDLGPCFNNIVRTLEGMKNVQYPNIIDTAHSSYAMLVFCMSRRGCGNIPGIAYGKFA